MAGASKRRRERQIFQAFLELHPLFAAEPIERWVQPHTDPPDIVCSTTKGRDIGVELKSWVHESEIATNRPRWDFFESAEEALEPQPLNESNNILVVRFHPRKHVSRVRHPDRVPFRSEFYRLITVVDNNWQQDWDRPRGHYWRDFSSDPTLSKYLDGLRFWPKRNRFGEDSTYPSGQPWIVPGIEANSFSEQSSQNSLRTVASKALKQYDRRRTELQGLDEFCLLIHYDEKALFYNSPAETARFKFEDHAREAATFLRRASSCPFDRIFLLIALEPRPRVFDVGQDCTT